MRPGPVAPVRIAVAGYGHMGRHHAEKVLELARRDAGVSLSGIADRDPAQARRAARLGRPVAPDLGDLVPRADAVIVAVPTPSHYEVVRDALEAGLDVLVEKPIAAELAQAEGLVALARRRGRVLQVGHQEWFNPALAAVRDRIRAPRFVEAHRVGPYAPRAADVDVVRDLMIHDLDIVLQIVGEEPARVDAVGVPVLSRQIDVANARLVFPGGCVAALTASRVARKSVRVLRLFERDAAFGLDFLAQTAFEQRRPAGGEGRPALEEFKGGPRDTLLAQLAAFVAAVRRRDGGEVKLGALRAALRVVEAMPRIAPAR